MEIVRESIKAPKYWLYLSLMLLCVLVVCFYELEIAAKIFLPITLILLLSNIFDFSRALVFAVIFSSILSHSVIQYQILPRYSFRIGIVDIIVLMQVGMLIMYRSLNPDEHRAKDIFLLPMVLFLLGAAVSFLVATDKAVGVSYLGLLLIGYLFYRYIIFVFNKEEDIKLLTGACVVALGFIVIRALVVITTGAAQARAGMFMATRSGFVFSGPNGLAGILVMLLPFAFIAFYFRNFVLRIVVALIFMVGVYLLFRTYSRNGYLSFIISSLVILIMLVRIKGKLALLSLLVVGIPLLLVGANFVIRLFSVTMFQVDPSALLRLVMWRSAVNEFLEFPLTGVGLANFYHATRVIRIGFCHNLYLNSFAEMGVFGGISVIVLLGMIFYYLINAYRKLKGGFTKYLNACLIGSWTAFSVNHMFDQICFFIDRTSEMKFFWFLLGLTAVFLLHVRSKHNNTL